MTKHKFSWGRIVGNKECPAWRRWVLPLPFGFSIRYHDFTPGHRDADPHSHPWWFITFVISGSYIDESYPSGRPSTCTCNVVNDRVRRFNFRYRPQNHVHRVRISSKGCKTIILTGRFNDTWGFYTPDGYMNFKDYRDSKWHETICDR